MHTVLEGFYGQTWSWQQRQFLVRLLAGLPQLIAKLSGSKEEKCYFQQYCYAPKSDKYLRQLWRESWPQETYDELQILSSLAQDNGVAFSVGLSPFALFEFWLEDEVSAKQALADKCTELAKLNLSSLGVFFDDMPAADSRTAKVQLAAIAFIQSQLPGLKLFFCPSYYSFDPVLEQLFGTMPENYWSDLGSGLEVSINVFWTGNLVISDAYDDDSLLGIAAKFKRPLTLWDNSCVNDGRLTSDFLPFKACTALSEIENLRHAQSFFVNPSNAFSVALLTLLSSCLTGDKQMRWSQVITLLPVKLQRFVSQYHAVFTTIGCSDCAQDIRESMLRDLDATVADVEFTQKTQVGEGGDLLDELIERLAVYLSRDIETWLNKGFAFDPECLT